MDAILYFEQSLRSNNSVADVTLSLFQITMIQIKQLDFYAAYSTLRRSKFYAIKRRVLERLQFFVEGVIFLMKRKFQEGVASLTKFLNKPAHNE